MKKAILVVVSVCLLAACSASLATKKEENCVEKATISSCSCQKVSSCPCKPCRCNK